VKTVTTSDTTAQQLALLLPTERKQLDEILSKVAQPAALDAIGAQLLIKLVDGAAEEQSEFNVRPQTPSYP